jgi:hypothetical protein
LLRTQTILLRLKAGSQEAAYLAAIFPLPKTPALVIIKNGELREYLAAGVTREDFMRRVLAALGSHAPQPTPPAPATAAPVEVQTPSSTPGGQPPIFARDILTESSSALKAQKKEQDPNEKAKKVAEAKDQKAGAKGAETPGSNSTADMKYALMQKKRQQEARDERARILKRVEDDKAARRQREVERKAQAKALAEGQILEPSTRTLKQAASTNSKECAVQIRLFDGSTIRSKFPSSGSLRKDVRPWIDEKQQGDVPYIFKQVLTPMPNKNIETSEEEQSLQSLGLTPSATLILVPVTGYTSAYEGDGGYVSRGVFAGYGLVSSGVGMVSGIFGSLLGSGSSAPAPVAEGRQGSPVAFNAPGPSINVRTLRDREDGRDDHQFYNGNAVSLNASYYQWFTY